MTTETNTNRENTKRLCLELSKKLQKNGSIRTTTIKDKVVNGIKPLLKKCVLCGCEIVGYGNNAEPLKKGYCCDKCNSKVIAVRMLK